ncbi:MAG TPA: rhodanese-like domain-containing protein [Gammaproteobacteria bacterium]|nr:rhodanese-like domain-containing protein [Gammaproteobacteria bacterium]
MSIPEISVHELQKLFNDKVDFLLLDVRNSDEYAFCNLGGYLIPLTELPQRLNELNLEQQIVVHCHAGGRSRRAVDFLLKQGFKNVCNLRGGITAWSDEIDSTIPKY